VALLAIVIPEQKVFIAVQVGPLFKFNVVPLAIAVTVGVALCVFREGLA
jgi:low affinity Fe/Cu permease